MKQSSAIRKILAAVVLVGVITFGKGAFAAQGRGSFTAPSQKPENTTLVAAAMLAVGIASLPSRKG